MKHIGHALHAHAISIVVWEQENFKNRCCEVESGNSFFCKNWCLQTIAIFTSVLRKKIFSISRDCYKMH